MKDDPRVAGLEFRFEDEPARDPEITTEMLNAAEEAVFNHMDVVDSPSAAYVAELALVTAFKVRRRVAESSLDRWTSEAVTLNIDVGDAVWRNVQQRILADIEERGPICRALENTLKR
jgi:hypothetical protein